MRLRGKALHGQVHMGCHTRETRLFVTQKARGIDSHTLLVGEGGPGVRVYSKAKWCKANGIMGLAPSSSSPTILQEIFKELSGAELLNIS